MARNMYTIHSVTKKIRRNTRKQGNTSAFDRKLFSSNARKIDIIIKEEGNKEENRQEEADVKKKKEEWIRRFKTTSSKCQNLEDF